MENIGFFRSEFRVKSAEFCFFAELKITSRNASFQLNVDYFIATEGGRKRLTKDESLFRSGV